MFQTEGVSVQQSLGKQLNREPDVYDTFALVGTPNVMPL